MPSPLSERPKLPLYTGGFFARMSGDFRKRSNPAEKRSNPAESKNATVAAESVTKLGELMTSQLLFYLYLAATIVIGCLCARRIRTPDDYYVAGRSAGVVCLAGSLLATILGSSAILGSIDLGCEKGWAGAWLLVCGSVGLLALLPFVKTVAAFRGYTLSMLIGTFYGETVRKLSGAVIAIAWLGVIGAQIIGAAKITSGTFGIPYVWAACAIGLTLTFYTTAGGQFSIIRTDVLQTLLIFLGILPVAVVLFWRSPSLQAAPMFSAS